MDVTKEIYNQLGGKLFSLYSGCKNILRDTEKNALRMTLPKNKSGANRLEIIYNAGKDTYTMYFYKWFSGRTIINFEKEIFKQIPCKETPIKKLDDIYCDQLLEFYTEITGISLPYHVVFG